MDDLIDIHNHILPGLDDGSRHMEETLQMLSQACAEGIGALVCTPHYHPGRKPPEAKAVEAAFQNVTEAAAEREIPIRLYLGSEIFYHDAILEDLEAGNAKSMNGTDAVLIEFYPQQPYSDIRHGLHKALSGGYIPILAHAERYMALLKKPALVEELTGMGCYIQLNAADVIGEQGREVKSFCRRLLKREEVHFIATDAHRAEGSRTMRLQKCASYIEKKYGYEYAERLFCDNPMRLIRGEIY